MGKGFVIRIGLETRSKVFRGVGSDFIVSSRVGCGGLG